MCICKVYKTVLNILKYYHLKAKCDGDKSFRFSFFISLLCRPLSKQQVSCITYHKVLTKYWKNSSLVFNLLLIPKYQAIICSVGLVCAIDFSLEVESVIFSYRAIWYIPKHLKWLSSTSISNNLSFQIFSSVLLLLCCCENFKSKTHIFLLE